jgi:glycosyltransferase involved in cell wall biosynthesis
LRNKPSSLLSNYLLGGEPKKVDFKCPVSVIVLTYNEEANIAGCLESIRDLTDAVLVVDSFSTDATLAIAREYTQEIYQNPWKDWAAQRNWALDHLPLAHEWILFLDADERITPDFATELQQRLAKAPPDLAGMNVHFRFLFLGRPLRFAYESPPVLRLVRRGRGRWQGEGAREYACLEGKTWDIKSQLDHWDRKDLKAWIAKQTGNAVRELQLQKAGAAAKAKSVDSPGTHERPWRRWLRDRAWQHLPRFWRTFPYFLYRYILRGGILDGRAGFAYCFLQALWYPLLIDMLLEESDMVQKMSGGLK